MTWFRKLLGKSRLVTHETHFYRRADGRWAWRGIAANGHIVATDGGQGYERRIDAERAHRNYCLSVARGESKVVVLADIRGES